MSSDRYQAQLWEKVVAFLAAFLIIVSILFLVIRNQKFEDPNLVVLIRILISLGVAVIGAVIPGFLNVDWSRRGLVIRVTGALAIFVLTLIYTPSVIPTTPDVGSMTKNHQKYSEDEFLKIKSVISENLENIGSLLIELVQPEGRSRYVDTYGLEVILTENSSLIQVTLSVKWQGGITGQPFVNRFGFKISKANLVHDLDLLKDDGFDRARNLEGAELSLKGKLDSLIKI